MTDWAIQQSVGNTLQKMVLMALADQHRHETGRCFPSITTISNMAECTRRGAMKAISALEEKGFIIASKTQGKSTQYCFPTSEQGSRVLVNEVHHTSERGSPPLVNVVHPTGERGSKTGERGSPEPGITGFEPGESARDVLDAGRKHPPENFEPEVIHVKQIRGRFPKADIPILVEHFKSLRFKTPPNWSARWYSYAMENANRFRSQSAGGVGERPRKQRV